MKQPAGIIRLAGTSLILVPVLTYLFSAICFGAGIAMNGCIFPVALFAALTTAPMLWRHNDVREVVVSAFAALAITVLSILLCHYLSDYSSDGCWYHQEGIVLMLDGWNPYRDSAPEGGALIWTLHYAKSMEIISAAIASATGSIEAGKAVNFIMAAATALLCYDFACRRICCSKRQAALFAAVAVGNPVLLVQLPTFYIDFTMYVYIILTIMLMIDAAMDGGNRPLVLVAALTVLAIGTKFNIFFMQGMTLIFATIYCMVTGRRNMAVKIIVAGVVALIIGLLAAWHPYAGNYLTHGHPLYPLLGDGAQDIMTENTPDIYTGNRFVDFFISLTHYAIPSIDARINGFTPAMSALLLLSAYSALRFRRLIRPLPLYIMGCALVGCFFFEQSWWARYNCQLWLVPVVACFCLLHKNGDKQARETEYCRRLFFALSLCAALFALIYTFPNAIHLNMWQRTIYAMRRDTPARIIDLDRQTARHFAEYGVEVESIGDSDLRPGSLLIATGFVYKGVFPMMEVSAEEYDKYLRNLGGPLLRRYSPRRVIVSQAL